MDERKTDLLRESYDCLASEYVERIYGELAHKPLDRQLLDRFAAEVGPTGPACDVGCGPGQVARYLRDRGVDISGVDLSPRMVEEAGRLNPGMEFVQGDMRALDFADGSLAGVVAFYSIIHLPRGDVADTLRELGRVLRPGGLLLVAFHAGTDDLHVDELWGQKVSIDCSFFTTAEMVDYLAEAGFDLEEAVERDPYPDVEYPSRRSYIFARPPAE
jgi:SAM-dependent methyltransferase